MAEQCQFRKALENAKMEVKLKNLGPLKEGEINLNKRFIVFVGYNNSGKTYTSQALWSLYYYNRDELFLSINYTSIITDVDMPTTEAEININITSEILQRASNAYNDIVKQYYLPATFNISAEDSTLSKFQINFEKNLSDVFVKSEKNFTIEVRDRNDKSPKYFLNIETKKGQDYICIRKDDNSLYTNQNSKRTIQQSRAFRVEERYAKLALLDLINEVLLDALFQSNETPFFLPASRTFFPSYYKYVFSSAKKGLSKINNIFHTNVRARLKSTYQDIEEISKRPHTEPVDVLIDNLQNLNQQKESNKYNFLLEELKELLGGEIEFRQVEGVAPVDFSLKINKNKSIDMYLASSASNQLATLYLYFKYWAKPKNNILFIDEPEENLHPSNQIKLVNILMKFANINNNKVILTTHSSLITETVNNYSHLAYIKENKVHVNDINNIDLENQINIKHDQFGVYFFNGDRIDEYKLTEYGAYFRDFDEVERNVRSTSNTLKDYINDIVENKTTKAKKKK